MSQPRARASARRRSKPVPGSRSNPLSERSKPPKNLRQPADRSMGFAAPPFTKSSFTPRDGGSATVGFFAQRIDSGTKIVRDQLDMS